MFSAALEELVNALRRLPGIGPKSAQRMAFFLLARDRTGGKIIGKQLIKAMENIGQCQQCRTFSEYSICSICQNQRRDPTLLCIVESPADMLAVEQTGFRGRYFVLHGHLSPIDGIGPYELGLEQLQQRLAAEAIEEIILATNPTVEGEATAHYISQLAKPHNIQCTRIAHGVPMGSELEYIDGGTLSRAFSGRQKAFEEES